MTAGAACCGCHGAPAPIPPNGPTAAALLGTLRARQARIHTLRGEAKVEFWDNASGDRIKATVLLWVMRDGHLRFDVESQVGPLSTLASNGQTFSLLDVRKNKYYVGKAAPCNVAQVIHIALPPAQVADALLGDAPLLPHQAASVSWNGQARRWVLRLELAQSDVETIELTDKELYVGHAELRDAAGRQLWALDHEDFQDLAGNRVPTRSRFAQGEKAEQDVTIKMRSQEVNLQPPEAAWHIEPPAGLAPEELRCEP